MRSLVLVVSLSSIFAFGADSRRVSVEDIQHEMQHSVYYPLVQAVLCDSVLDIAYIDIKPGEVNVYKKTKDCIATLNYEVYDESELSFDLEIELPYRRRGLGQALIVWLFFYHQVKAKELSGYLIGTNWAVFWEHYQRLSETDQEDEQQVDACIRHIPYDKQVRRLGFDYDGYTEIETDPSEAHLVLKYTLREKCLESLLGEHSKAVSKRRRVDLP